MSSCIAQKLAEQLIRNGANPDKREVYAYGIECTINTIFTFGIILIAAVLTKNVLITVIWMMFFLPIRKTSGGIHAASRGACFIISLSVGIGCMLLNSYIVPFGQYFSAAGFAVSIIIVFSCAPVIHKNHPIPQTRIRKIKKTARTIIVIESLISVIFIIANKLDLAVAATMGVLSASVSTILGYILQHIEQNRSL